MKYSKRIAGKRAQKSGADFEGALARAMSRQGWHLIRIQNGCESIGGKNIRRVRQPFDFVALGPGEAVLFFDAKRNQAQKSITFGLFQTDSSKHQRAELAKVSLLGRKAGFVLCLDALNCIYWVPVLPSGMIDLVGVKPWGPLSMLKPVF